MKVEWGYMPKTRFLPVFAAGLLAACAGLPPLGANQQDRFTKAGQEVELAHWAYWDNNCEGEEFDINILTPPASGRTEIREAVFAIPTKNSSGQETGCVDKIIESKKVIYIPNDGFSGADQAVIEFTGSSGVVTNAYSITVR